MPMVACQSCEMSCTFGTIPSLLMVLPENRVLASELPAATIMDNEGILNVPTFGMCSSLANPTVSSATSAAQGVLTPMPCVPLIPAPWLAGNPQVLVGGMPILRTSDVLTCAYAGVITFGAPAQTTVMG